MKGNNGAFLGLLLAASAVALCSCMPDAVPDIRVEAGTAVPEGMGLVIWIDAVDLATFKKLQQSGQLPHITRYLIDRGVTVEDAVASLPTITYTNNVSFVTGLYPGHHGITDNKWFDRYSLICRDYNLIKAYRTVDRDYPGPTIYELLNDEFTASILTPIRRGATRNIDNWMQAGLSWFFDRSDMINKLTTWQFELVSRQANAYGRWCKFIFAYYATPDDVCHRLGLTQPYEEILRHIDLQVGLVCQSLERAGLLEKTTIALVSDHGMVDTPNHLDLLRYFRKDLGVRTLNGDFGYDEMFEQRLEHFGPARAVVCVGGDRHAAIHLRPGDRWHERPTPEEINTFAARFGSGPAAGQAPLPEMLARLPATDLVMVRLGDDSVRLLGAGGEATINRVRPSTGSGRPAFGSEAQARRELVEGRRDGVKLYRYTVTRGQDPLGYDAHPAMRPLLDGRGHDAEEWFRASLQTDRPDCIVQLMEMNDSPRSGDIVLFAREGWDFGTHNLAGHGGVARREIVVPWIWAGPGLPRKASVRGGRTVDLMPTMLHLIGRARDVPPGLDGRSLADRLTRAGAETPLLKPPP